MGLGISHRQKVMCPLLNGLEIFAIIYARAYSTDWTTFSIASFNRMLVSTVQKNGKDFLEADIQFRSTYAMDAN